MKTEKIMGIDVDCLTYEQIIADVPQYFTENKKMTVMSVNPQIVTESSKYPEIVSFINQSTHRIPDGIGIVLVSKLKRGKIKQRITGFDVMIKFLDYANTHHLSIFLYGAKPDVLKLTVKNVKKEYPNINIVGTIDGYTQLSNEDIVLQMNQAKADFVFVALGFPKQEQWLADNYANINATVFQDVGGSFDVISGTVKRAPDIFIKLHLEWLYRSLSNPKRFVRILQLPVFLVKSIWWEIKH